MTRKKSNHPEALILECFEDDLNQAQVEAYLKAEREMLAFRKKLNNLHQTNTYQPLTVSSQPIPANNQQLVFQGSQPQQNNIMVVEQNGLHHLVVGCVSSSQQPSTVVTKNNVKFPTTTTTTSRTPRILSQPRISLNSNLINSNIANANSTNSISGNRPKAAPSTIRIQAPSSLASSVSAISKIQVKNPGESKLASLINRPLKPKTKLSVVVDLTSDKDDDFTNEPDSTSDQKEVAIGKVSEKTFPSLVVNVRVYLKTKELSASAANAERMNLDAKVKRVLMLTPTTFTEWLLQQGLLKSEHFCLYHDGVDGSKNNSKPGLKLGMYSDASKFPYSGGYVWISECCPNAFVSVFCGSLFEGAPHSPTVILKLIYHWCCQTIVQNVLQWVKVDNLYLKTMYTNLRAVCTAAIHEKYGKLGGNNKKIEVGVISLGTTTQDGHMKHIKVEVLGVFEPETKRLRLKALEPIADNEGQLMKKKFLKILEPLQQWVEKDSFIITDYTVDKKTCIKMGFTNVVQYAHGTLSTQNQPTNQAIMDYLRKVIPKMFQNTLSLLSRQIIQQFLDELVWRETWGPIPSKAFDQIVNHLSEQTRLHTGGSLIHRLARIAANPLKNWKYDNWAANCRLIGPGPSNRGCESPSSSTEQILPAQSQLLERALLNVATAPPPPIQPNAPNQVEAAMIALEPYYYGTLPGKPFVCHEKYSHNFKCVMCKVEFVSVMQFTEHLISHAFNKKVGEHAETKELCKLCLKVCPKTSNHNLNTHSTQVHSDRQTCRTLCKICSVKHKDPASLQSHMISSHCELDMPYHCDICEYRTSILDNIHQHFYTAHQTGVRGYCPYCLKVMQFATLDGKNLTKNQLRFVLHIQKHQLTVNRKCEKCLLNFTHRHILKDHQDHWHQTCKMNEDVERFTMEECTLMAAPLIDPMPPSTSAIDTSCKGTLKLNFDTSNEFCCECDGNITPDHFVGHLLCSKCRFQTCCNYSMKEHNALMHGTSLLHLRPPVIGVAPILDQPWYCACGFSSWNGNTLASHMIDCGNNTCYSSKKKLEEIVIKSEDLPLPTDAKRRKYDDGR